MASIFEGAMGLSSAAALLQVQLGVGMALGALGLAVSSIPELSRLLVGKPWEATLHSAALAASSVPLLAAFTLTQVRGALPDPLSTIGIAVATVAVSVSAFAVVLGPIRSGGATTALRVLNSFKAFGMILLTFANLPTNPKLLCVSMLLRAALVQQAASAVLRAAGLGPNTFQMVLEDLDSVFSSAPLLAGAALLDSVVNPGAASVLWFAIHPATFCLAIGVLTLLLRAAGQAEELASPPTLDSIHTAGLLGTIRFGLHFAHSAAMALLLAGIFIGSFSVEASSSGFAIEWGEPLTAAAAQLLALVVGVQVAAFLCVGVFGSGSSEDTPPLATPPINGVEIGSSPVTSHIDTPMLFKFTEALLTPAQPLLLAILAAQATSTGARSPATIPFRYGFILAVAAMWFQVLALIIFSVLNMEERGFADPPFDATGTLNIGSRGGVGARIGSCFRWSTIALLEGGIFLGCAGLHPLLWIGGGLLGMILLYSLAKEEVRKTMSRSIEVILGALVACGGTWFEGFQRVMDERRKVQEAKAAQRAAAVAKALVAESGPAKTAEKKAAGTIKTSKPKSGGDVRRRHK